MKAGLTISGFAHAVALAWGMVSLAAPPPLSAPDVEALPIDIVPIEELTKAVQGDRTARPAKTPAKKPTVKPVERPNAQNAGDADNDRKSDAVQVKKAPAVEKTEAPSAEPEKKEKVEPTPVPTPKIAAEPKPKTDIAMLLKDAQEQLEDKPVEESFQKLPSKVATPKRRPERKKPQIAQTNQRKIEEARQSSKSSTEKAKDKAVEKAVVNKADANAGGAKRSKKDAALGTRKASTASKLAQSELDALRGRLEGCWSVGDLTGHPDAQTMRARVTFNLTRDGEIDGRVVVKVSGTDRSTRATLTVRVRAAVTECAPYNLPQEKYDTWSQVVVNFSLQDML